MEGEKKEELFFPYYVNQGRLLDVYAILNQGYSEYSEISTAINNEEKKSDTAEINSNIGFKLFNFGGRIEGNSENTNNNVNEHREKKVQTVTSVLSLVKNTLEKKGYLCEINSTKVGSFICIPVVLSINSISLLMEEVAELVKLLENIKKLDLESKIEVPDKIVLKNMQNTIKVLCGGQEIICEKEKYAIIGNVVDSNLYQASRADIIGTEIKCLAQVKKIYPNGTELMKNTIFTKLKDKESKKSFIDYMNNFTRQDFYDFDVVAISSIYDKPVFQIEIIALYQ